MKVELTVKQAAIVKTLLKQDIANMKFFLDNGNIEPGDEGNVKRDIKDNEEIIALLEGGANG